MKLKSFLKSIWKHIWPTAKQKELTIPQDQLNSKLDEDLKWLDLMAGAFVFWDKNHYETWRENGMFYISVPNRETGFVCCAPKVADALEMAMKTLKKQRNIILGCDNTRRSPKDFRDHPWEQSYIIPYNVMIYDNLIYLKGDIVSYTQLSKILKPNMLDAYAKAWRYTFSELQIEPCSEQSVILKKMDEIYEHK